MPRLSGLTHALAALAAIFLAPVLKAFVGLLVSTEDVTRAVGAAGRAVADHPLVSLDAGLSTTLVYLAILLGLAFLYGYAVHVTRHGSG